jgi:hypothetical protein
MLCQELFATLPFQRRIGGKGFSITFCTAPSLILKSGIMFARIRYELVWFPVGKIGPTSANLIHSNTESCSGGLRPSIEQEFSDGHRPPLQGQAFSRDALGAVAAWLRASAFVVRCFNANDLKLNPLQIKLFADAGDEG